MSNDRLAQAIDRLENSIHWLQHGRDGGKLLALEDMKALHNAIASPAQEQPQPVQPLGFVKPDNDRQVFFYEQDFYVLSNFSAFTLHRKGIRFDTSEAAYHYDKFDTDNPFVYDIAGQIAKAPSAHEAFKIAERNKRYRRPDWDDVKVGIMRDILRAKVHQHEYVRRKLLATGDRELIEDSWRDGYWGWGPNRDGKNMLGRLWMEVRSELRGQLGDTGTTKQGELMTSKADLSAWFDRGASQGATHLIVVCDTFDHEDFPVYARGDSEVVAMHKNYSDKSMHRIMEVYDLRLPKEQQMAERRAMHLPAGDTGTKP